MAICWNAHSQEGIFDRYNVVWDAPSKHSGESMPLGGGDIGLNVWVEDGALLFYMSRSGAFDENNTLLKLGRVRVELFPNPFDNGNFKQELKLADGYVNIEAESQGVKVNLDLWVDVFSPTIHIDISANRPLKATATYESWRFRDLFPEKRENNANSWKWAPQGIIRTAKDSINFENNSVLFYHENADSTIFDVAVRQQGLDQVKNQLYNPLQKLTSGGAMVGKNMRPAGVVYGRYMDTDFKGWKLESVAPARKHHLQVGLHVGQHDHIADWKEALLTSVSKASAARSLAKARTMRWWNAYWQRSYIIINPDKNDDNDLGFQVGRNYQLFRYMLGCNAYGKYPTKFNGGLFTYDPLSIDSSYRFTPDFRNWGGGTHTAQNQRLVYWPMLRSGDFDMLKSQFHFYTRLLRNAELRTETYWGHQGASFTEQLENFGLPNPAEYSWKRPADFDKGVEYNAWLEYQWDTVLEFCMMMLETHSYVDADIREYIPFIESCLRFFDEHYQYRARQRGAKVFAEYGHLVFYPGSSAETYKMAYNASTTVAGLRVVVQRLLELPDQLLEPEKRAYFQELYKRIPPLSFRTIDGRTMLSPAKLWERINNTESPQLYPVYPWGIYGLGRPGLDTAINTFKYDPDVLKFRSHIGWKQDNIFAARLGLTEEAREYTTLKLKDSDRRFPAFWGPGFDWVPDHNWGGSGMIGLQEMLLQSDGVNLFLLPAWPDDWDVDFKLHAPHHTTVEISFRKGKIQKQRITPADRERNIFGTDTAAK
ncbi:DUF5703 domain-containing protein [Parapedobacter tibetensis]|uniref:DUF5703 domain-containing protein n=1 Tax=Parapedobacter tibetensis TaxID=2972951 RepID=UPI00214D8988|nr:DUF5703 domain-containing protein [Parapedobacter tibetensis]